MRRDLVLTVLAIPALALALWARPAHACGSYGPPTDEDQVSRAAWSELHNNFVDSNVRVSAREVDGERGMARVDATVDRAGKRVAVVLLLARVDGRWTLAGRIDRPARQSSPSSPSSAAGKAPSKVRKTR